MLHPLLEASNNSFKWSQQRKVFADVNTSIDILKRNTKDIQDTHDDTINPMSWGNSQGQLQVRQDYRLKLDDRCSLIRLEYKKALHTQLFHESCFK